MVVYVRVAGMLVRYLGVDTPGAPRRVTLAGASTLAGVVAALGIPEGLVAFGHVAGRMRRLDEPVGDGETITLQMPAAGG